MSKKNEPNPKPKADVNDAGASGAEFRPSFGAAVICVVFLIVFMAVSIFFFDQKMHVAMMASLGVTLLVLKIEKCPWSKIEKAIIRGGELMIPTAMILYSIGALMGAWIASGTVPMIIYWGLKIISPSMFLATACLACMLTSLATGSSWSAIGTAGVALMGVGMGLGVNPAMTAGAIVSGAAFGDKMSPLSDTTNLAPAVAEGDVFDHIKAMFFTTTPSIIIALAVFLVLGFKFSGTAESDTIQSILTALESNFNLNLLTLIPPVLVITLAILKKPAFPILLISGGTAALIAMVVQGYSLGELFSIMEGGFVSETGNPGIDSLLSRGGLLNMNYTWRMKFVSKSVGTLVCSTVVSCVLFNIITASQYMSIILGGRLFIGEFKKKDMLPQTLSRCLEDGGTVTSLIVPWNVDGAFAGATLGVPVLSFLPFAVFNWLVPIVSITFGFLGKFQWKTGEIKSTRTYRDSVES